LTKNHYQQARTSAQATRRDLFESGEKGRELDLSNQKKKGGSLEIVVKEKKKEV